MGSIPPIAFRISSHCAIFIHSVFHLDDVINAFIQKVFMLNVATTPLKEKNTHFSLWSSNFSTRALKSNES